MKSKLRQRYDGWLALLRGLWLLGFDSLVLLGGRQNDRRCEGAIFCLHGLGDLLLAGHAITALSLQMRSQGLRSVLFVQTDWVEFARKYFDVDEVSGIDRHRFTRRFGYRAEVLKSVAGRFALAVQPTYNRMLRVEDCLMRATQAAVRIGNLGHPPFITAPERRCGDACYTKLIPAESALRHELERYAEFMAGMGLACPINPWPLPPPGASEILPLPSHAYLVVAPNASDRRRSWPMDNFVKVVRQIAEKHHLAVVIIGDSKKSTFVRWPEAALGGLTVYDLSGQVETKDLPAILAQARLVLSNDSGVYHLGVSLQCPTLAVGGSGLPVRYFPYPNEATLGTRVIYLTVPCAGCNWRCIYTPSRNEPAWCMEQIAWPEVVAAADQFLENKS